MGKQMSSFSPQAFLKVFTRNIARNKHTSLRKLDKLKHFNLQIIQLHQVWSHRRKERGWILH